MRDKEQLYYILAHAALKQRLKSLNSMRDMAYDGNIEGQNAVDLIIKETQEAIDFFFEKSLKR